MKKICLLLVCAFLTNILLTGCQAKPKKSLIQSQRRFGKYFQEKPIGDTIDLSEGPKLKYDAKIGPQDVNFDFKIVNPY